MTSASDADLADVWAQVGAAVRLGFDGRSRRLVVSSSRDLAEATPIGSTDVHVIDLRRRDRAAALRLPHDDSAYDAVAVIGVFEHLSNRDRERFSAELSRVCAGVVAAVAPIASPFAATPTWWRPRRTGLARMLAWRLADRGPVELRLTGRVTTSTLDAAGAGPFGGCAAHDRSHAIAWFELDGRDVPWSWRWYGRRSRRSLLEADLRNSLQQAPSDGRDRHWVRWRVLVGDLGADGVRAVDAPALVRVEVPSSLRCVAVTVSIRVLDATTDTGDPQVTGGDGTWTCATTRCDDDGTFHARFVPPHGRRDSAGDVEVLVPTGTVVSVVKLDVADGDVTDLGVEVRPGPNLTMLCDDGVRVGWHLESDRSGWLPSGAGVVGGDGAVRPIPVWHDRRPIAEPTRDLRPYTWDLVHMFQSSRGFHLPAPWRLASPATSAAARRRVLVVAHMFPVPFNPVSGAFVFEAVRAIVSSGDARVRVICPVPFWGPGWRTYRARRAANRLHAEALSTARATVYELDGVEVQYVPYYVPAEWHRHGAAVESAVRGLMPVIREFGPDVVHAHSGYVDGRAAAMLARAVEAPLIITEHTGPLQRLFDDHRIAAQVRSAYGVAAQLLGVSAFQAAEMRRLAPATSHKVDVQFNGFDADVYRPVTSDDHPDPLLLYVGYITRAKGLELLVHAFGEIVRRHPGARLTIAGDVADASLMRELLADARAHAVEHRIEFIGGCTRAQVAHVMARADVLVLPSEGETFGCVLVEALGVGVPVVSTTCGGPEDIAAGEPAVRLVPVGDATGLVDAIDAVWTGRHEKSEDPSGTFRPESIASRSAKRFAYATIAHQLVERYDSVTRPGEQAHEEQR